MICVPVLSTKKTLQSKTAFENAQYKRYLVTSHRQERPIINFLLLLKAPII